MSRRARAAVPLLILVLFWIVTAMAHVVDSPDLTDPGTLSPQGTGPDGSSVLNGLLSERGVTVIRVTSSEDALTLLSGRDATVFLPAPDYVSARFWSELSAQSGFHRVVLVRPGTRARSHLPATVEPDRERWAAATAAPDCSTGYATDAGPAAVRQTSYTTGGAPTDTFCYGGGLVGLRAANLDLLYVGATDPFRNGRIHEHGNARLATGVLGQGTTVIWVDIHTWELDPPGPVPTYALPRYRRDPIERTNTGNHTIDAFPAVFWAALILAAAMALLTAFVRARRLGPPVAEPLPVLVPGAETVTGRGRLYHRIHARAATLDALRASAITRIARVLYPFAGPNPERDLIARPDAPLPAGAAAFVDEIAARTGAPASRVGAILYGRAPEDDEGLADAVDNLDALTRVVVHDPPRTTTEEERRD
jgi:hypothetical protein